MIINYAIYFIAGLLGSADELGIPNSKTTNTQLGDILNVVYLLAGIIAIIVVIIGGIRYTTSSGNPGEASKAKNTILYAMIGLIVVVTAFAITNFVIRKV